MEKEMTNENQTRLDVLASISIDENKTKWTKIGVAFPLKKRARLLSPIGVLAGAERQGLRIYPR